MEERKKTEGQLLEERLLTSFDHIAEKMPEDIDAAEKFAEGYKAFLNMAKTEREVVDYVLRMAEEKGYRPLERGKKYSAGSKVYFNNRGKSIILSTIGKKSLAEGVRLNIAHIDSPRLDLKPNPLYEKDELAYFKTHYYGGIRKYQWGVTPLALHGRVMLEDGTNVDLCIGEEPGDPVFVITDLLPHLSRRQNERTLAEGLKGEELNILLGSTPVNDKEVKKKFKLKVMTLLNEKYGMTEADFMRAELTLVPAQKAVDVGLDRSMIGAYGQDDRVCAYPAIVAEMENTVPEYTTVTVLADKEEIGSEGVSGMASDMLLHYLEDLCEAENIRVRDVLRNASCLSADVNAAFDPTFPDVFEKENASYINKGPVLTKYTGSRGKSGSNDASAEMMYRVIKCMNEAGVMWQIGELGKVDEGGGGTIAKFVADMDVDTVDLGVAVLAMHAPFEITSKLDLYHTYKAFKAFNG